jgi:UDP-N-acetylglucosamine--N-acetylmuramyl-(pentapeptide) pyrophosphoryl-undecaprenol N-acetylglucosamine transferase
MTCFAVIAGGGTSGHVLPALAIAESIIDSGHTSDEIVYFGARRGIETRLVPPAGITLHLFDVVGLKREFSFSAIANNALFIPKLLRAWVQALRRMKRLRPQVVVSVGGYASLPAVLSARLLKIPVVVVTYDRTPGKSSALTSRFAAAVASAFPDSPLPRSHYTGAPVRRDLRTLDRAEQRQSARELLGIDNKRFVIGVMGGSLGSGVLNEVIRDYVQHRSNDAGLAIRHIVGERFLIAHQESLVAAGIASDPGPSFETRVPGPTDITGLLYQVVGYQNDMAAMYAAVDVLIGRGGAGTVAEVAVTGTPAILIPWSGAADDHQSKNVAWLADAGGAIFITEKSCRQELPRVLDSIRDDPQALEKLSVSARALGEKNRVGAIAELIENVAGAKKAP